MYVQSVCRDNYPGGECPDCGEPIPHKANDGESCVNCGHVFFGPDAVLKNTGRPLGFMDNTGIVTITWNSQGWILQAPECGFDWSGS